MSLSEIEQGIANLSIEPELTFSSFAGKTLKLNNASDVQDIITELKKELENNSDAKRVHIKLSGNTIGVDAAKELANAFQPIANLHVCVRFNRTQRIIIML